MFQVSNTQMINQNTQLKVSVFVRKHFAASLKLSVESMSKSVGSREFQLLIVLDQKLNLWTSHEVWTGMKLRGWEFQVAALGLCWTWGGMLIPMPSLEDSPLPVPDSLSTGIRTGLICNVLRSQPNFLASICFQFLKQCKLRRARGSATGGLPALGRTPSSGANR